jgi:hypothetical protein
MVIALKFGAGTSKLFFQIQAAFSLAFTPQSRLVTLLLQNFARDAKLCHETKLEQGRYSFVEI